MAKKSGLQSLLRTLTREGAKALAALRQEIAGREKELEMLKGAEARWKDVVGEQTPVRNSVAAPHMRAGRKKRRIDWNVVLAGFSTPFKAKDVQQKTGKPIEQVYAGVSRWAKDKKIKKNPDGTYQRTAAVSTAQQKRG